MRQAVLVQGLPRRHGRWQVGVVLSLERCRVRSQFNPLNCERKAGVQTPCSTFPGTPCSSAQPPCTPPAGGRAGSCRSRVVPLPQAPKAVLSTQPRKRATEHATEGRWGVHAPLVQVALACLPGPLAPASQEAKLGAMAEGWCLPTAPQLHGPTHSKALK